MGWGEDPSYRQLIVVDCHATKRPVFEVYQSYHGPSAERAIGPSPNASKLKAHHAQQNSESTEDSGRVCMTTFFCDLSVRGIPVTKRYQEDRLE